MLRTLEDYIAAGEHLIEVKENLPRGDWEAWLREDYGKHPDTARKYIRVARRKAELNPAATPDLESALRILSPPRPEPVAEDLPWPEERDDTGSPQDEAEAKAEALCISLRSASTRTLLGRTGATHGHAEDSPGNGEEHLPAGPALPRATARMWWAPLRRGLGTRGSTSTSWLRLGLPELRLKSRTGAVFQSRSRLSTTP